MILPSGTTVGQSQKTNIHVELASAIHEMFQMTNIVVIDASKSHSNLNLLWSDRSRRNCQASRRNHKFERQNRGPLKTGQ